jgi:hypothetical protein
MKTTLVTLLIVTMACFVAGGTLQASFDPNNGLVAHYPFDGNASDMSGNGNHGTVNGASLGTDRHGISGKAYSFDGVDDLIDTGDEWGNFGTSPVSISFWLNRNTNDNCDAILSKGSYGNEVNQWYLRTDQPIGDGPETNIHFTFSSGGTSTDRQGIHSKSQIRPGLWRHVVVERDSTGMSIYIDGQLDNRETSSPINADSDINVKFGYADSWVPNDMRANASIDNVRIYNRALSAADVAGLYELERPKDSDFDGLFDTYETYLGTDPNVADTDGDGLNDGQEVTAGTNPKISDKTVIDAVKVNSANFGLAPLSNLTATGATPHTNGWYYQPEWGWVWTNANVFPYVYRSSLGDKQAGWLYFRERSAPPYFHDYATGTWTKLGE